MHILCSQTPLIISNPRFAIDFLPPSCLHPADQGDASSCRAFVPLTGVWSKKLKNKCYTTFFFFLILCSNRLKRQQRKRRLHSLWYSLLPHSKMPGLGTCFIYLNGFSGHSWNLCYFIENEKRNISTDCNIIFWGVMASSINEIVSF